MTLQNLNLSIHHVTRVEGHGNILVNLTQGNVEKCEWHVPEAPRFFEAMVVGREWHEISYIVSRICGICSIGHTFASLKATEAAFGIQISPQTRLLRRILAHGENFQSHILHVFFLVAPDLLGVPSVFPLVATHPDVVKLALKLKRLANDMCDVFGGRTTHPNNTTVGGFTGFPSVQNVEGILQRLKDARADLAVATQVIASLVPRIPVYERETEFVALKSDEEYAIYDGWIASTDMPGVKIPVDQYRSVTNEYMLPQSTAKWCRHKRESYFAGALARFNLNYDQLIPQAKEIAAAVGLKPICYNTFMNNAAQYVETIHSVEEAIRLIEELLATGIKEEAPVRVIKAGTGAGAVDVPRGILFHEYSYDDQGRVTAANCIIPTNENHRNIELDLQKFLKQLIAEGKDEKGIALGLEMMVRAYDPCISCSTHYLDVSFKR
jgi:coenzyme F420-reducing hydrogenase alpha subunit